MLTDFGLAKDVESDSKMTTSGVTLGTPSYMSPEQAGGRLSEVGPSSDVYSLGATLYEMLSGEPPFQGSSTVDVLQKVLTLDPEPLRRSVPSIDRDLETICLKCLDKTPGLRYSSARALARDLGLYLEGAPILARRASLIGKILRRASRNRLVSAILLVLALCVAGGALAAGLGFRARASAERSTEESSRSAEGARKQAAEAQETLDKAARISSVLRAAATELADVRRELESCFGSSQGEGELRPKTAELWKRVEAFEKEVPEDAASRAAWTAVKGWLRRLAGYREEALGLFDLSRKMDPDVPYGALFEAMLHLHEYLLELPIPSPMWTSQGVVFDPVSPPSKAMLGIWKRFQGSLDGVDASPVWGESTSREFLGVIRGFEALRDGRFDTAEGALTKALRIPEMEWLRTELRRARAVARYYCKDFAGAAEDIESVLALHPDSGWAWFILAEIRACGAIETDASGEDPREAYRKGIETFDKLVGRGNFGARIRSAKAVLHTLLGKAESDRGGDPDPHFQEALDGLGSLIEEGIDRADSLASRGQTRLQMGAHLESVGLDPRECYGLAVADLTEALGLDPGSRISMEKRWAALVQLGKAELDRGGDGEPHFRAVTDESEKLEGAATEAWGLHYNAAGAWAYLARVLAGRGAEAETAFRTAISHYEKALALSGDGAAILQNQGETYLMWAKAYTAAGRDPRPLLEKAQEALAGSLAVDGEHAGTHRSLGTAYHLLGQVEDRGGKKRRSWFSKALASYGKALLQAPGDRELYLKRANVYFELGDAASERGENPIDLYQRGVDDCSSAIAKAPDFAEARAWRGNMLRRIGEWAGKHGRKPDQWYEKALGDYDESIRLDPSPADVYLSRAVTRVYLADARSDRGEESRELYRDAARDGEEALKRKPDFFNARWNMGNLYNGWAEAETAAGGDPRELLEKAAANFTEALRLAPDHFISLNNRGYGRILLGVWETEHGLDPRDAYRKAIPDLEKAVSVNPSSALTFYNLGRCFRNLAVEEFVRGSGSLSLLEKAIRSFGTAADRNRAMWQARVLQGRLLEQVGRFGEALQAYRKAHAVIGDRFPELPAYLSRAETLEASPAWYRKLAFGFHLFNLGGMEDALQLLEAALREGATTQEAKNAEILDQIQEGHLLLAEACGFLASGLKGPRAEPSPPAPERAKELRAKALASLESAFQLGYRDVKALESRKGLESLKDLAEFKALVENWRGK